MAATMPLQPFSYASESLPRAYSPPYSSPDNILDRDSLYSSYVNLLDGDSLPGPPFPEDPFNVDLPSEYWGNSPNPDAEPRDTLFARVWRIILKFLRGLLPKGLGPDAIRDVIKDLYDWLVNLFKDSNPDAASHATEPPHALAGTHYTPNTNGIPHAPETSQVQTSPIVRNTPGGGPIGRSPSTEHRVPAPVRRATAGGVPEHMPGKDERSDRSNKVPVRKSRSSSETGLQPDVRSHRQRL